MDPKYQATNPGFSVLVVQDGQIVYERQSGLANLRQGRPITPDTRFNIGSVTKQFTAACILLLEEEGRLRRSDPVQKYLPELPDFGQPVTLDHLLAHTSGIPDPLEILGLQDRFNNQALRPENIVAMLRRAPNLSFAPGSDFAYSNTGYMLLALVVERVSGLSLGEFLQRNIFQPLQMQQSIMAREEKDGLPDGTKSYVFQPGKKKFKHLKPTDNALGATGVHTTLRDFVQWDQNFYHNRLGQGEPALIEALETPYLLLNGANTHYGGGLFLKKYRGLDMVSHSGGWSSFLLEYRRFPAQGISILVASNNDFSSPFPLADLICNRILSFPPAPDFTPDLSQMPCPAEQLQGTFLSDNNFVRRVRFDSTGLAILIPGAVRETSLRLAYRHAVGDSLVAFVDERGDTVVFHLDAQQDVMGFSWQGGHFLQLERFYQKLPPPQVGAATGRLAGKYRSAEYRQTLKIKRHRRTGQLKLSPVFFLGYPLEPLGGDAFWISSERIVVRFYDDKMVLGNDWVRGLTLQHLK